MIRASRAPCRVYLFIFCVNQNQQPFCECVYVAQMSMAHMLVQIHLKCWALTEIPYTAACFLYWAKRYVCTYIYTPCLSLLFYCKRICVCVIWALWGTRSFSAKRKIFIISVERKHSTCKQPRIGNTVL